MKVFISSTYKDLIDYRTAAIRAVEGTNYQASKMEVFGARPDEPLDACLKEVEESELFIGIYALRYGFIPEGADISITEMEYAHAKKLGKTIYCFLLDEENQPWLKKWIEGEPGKAKLENFKQRIQKVHVCDYFTTADDLRAKVSNALSHYVAKYLESLSPASKNELEKNLSEENKRNPLTAIKWDERNKEAIDYFISLCDEIDKADEDQLISTFNSWDLIGETKNGLNFSTDGAMLFGPTERLPVGYHTDVMLEDNRFSPAILRILNGNCLTVVIKELNNFLSELWSDTWEDPLERDNLGRPKKVTKYPQTAIVEAMVNFVIHRDYTVDDLGLISIENEYIEFTNPGTSPYSAEELLSSPKPLHPKYRRNNLIVKTISRTRLNQRQGGGIIRIREALVDNGNYIESNELGLQIENILEQNRFQLRIYQRKKPSAEALIETKPSYVSLPVQPFFVGREREVEIIKSALSPDSRVWGAFIYGPGGIGKTALAIKAAHDAPAELFERKIFITAKVRELTAEGEAKLTDFTRPTYLAMLDELGKELGANGLEKLTPDERPNELRLMLASKKVLIIFDNLETLPEDERTRLFQFLSRLPTGNKAIVTSRRRSDVDAHIVHLAPLTRDEALQLIAELATKYPNLARAHEIELVELYFKTQGNPLLIRWIAGQLGRQGSKLRTISETVQFINNAPQGNDPLEYIFGDLLETFTADETKVLAALTYFTQPAKLKWIADMTNLPERQAETALEDLTDRSILITNFELRTYVLPPLTAKFIRTRRPEAVTQTGDALTDRAYALAMQYGGKTNYEGFPMLDPEWSFISAALPRLLTGDNDRLQTLCNQLFQFLHFTGRWDELLWLSQQAEIIALAANDYKNAGWRAYQAGVIYSLRNQPAEVLRYAARAAANWQDSTSSNKALAIRMRGLGHKLNKDYPAAIAAFREALEIWRSISIESDDVALGLSDMANAEHAIKDYTTAERDYREALRIAKIIKNDEGVANYTGNLAGLALDREQWAEAESLAREALVLAEKVGRQELIATDCHRLAIALLKQNKNLDEAVSLSRRAVEIYTRLRLPDDVQSAQETLAEIEKASK